METVHTEKKSLIPSLAILEQRRRNMRITMRYLEKYGPAMSAARLTGIKLHLAEIEESLNEMEKVFSEKSGQ